jgi:heat shock protein HslJ
MGTRTRAKLGAAVMTVAALAACGQEDGVSVGGSDLAGKTFVSTNATQDGEDGPLVAGSRITLTFTDQALSANAGCNTMGGGMRIDDGVLVLDGPMAQTEMACEQPLMDQDAWLATFLASGPAVALDDATLTLTSEGTVVTFVDREVAEPDVPLEGTVWTLDAIGGAGGADAAVSSVPEGVTSTIRIGTDGRLAAHPGCNTGSAPVEVGDGVLIIGPMALTRMMCEPAAMEVEDAVVAVLQGEVTYAVTGDLLQLTSPAGSLTYRAG